MLKKLLYILVLFFLAKTTFAQNSSLYLQVVDQNSSLISKVTTRIKSNHQIIKEFNQETPQEISFPNLKSGTYILEVQAEGFKPISQEIIIKTGKNQLTIKLEVAEIIENVEVSRDAQETSVDNAFSNFLTREQIMGLPDNPKEFEKALKRIAGDEEAIIRVDGFTGGAMPQKSQIASIRIVSSSFDAENHELGYTYVDVTTKPGNQRFSGSLSFNFNDESLNARNAFSPKSFSEQTKNTLFFLSGPIKKDKAAFSVLVIDLRNFKAQNINAVLPSGIINDSVSNQSDYTSINTGIRQNLSKSHNAAYSYHFTNSDSKNTGVGGFNLPERAFDSNTIKHQFRFSESGYIDNKFLNEIRFQLINEKTETIPNNKSTGIIVLDSFSRGGAGNYSKSNKLSLLVADNLLFGYKNHALKVGFQAEFEKRREILKINNNGTFIFSSLADFNLNKPSIFTQNLNTREISLSQIQFGTFLQDDLRIKKNLNLSFGLRYEIQSNLRDYNNFSPRIGFIWSPLKTGKLTFRGGSGVFYNWLGNNDLSTILSNDFSQSTETIIINPGFPNPFSSGTSQVLAKSFWQKDTNLKNPYIIHASIGAESRLNKNLMLRANYVYQKGLHQFRSRNLNAPLLGIRPNLSYGNIINVESSAFFLRNSLEIGLSGNLRKNISFYFDYNLAKTISDNNGIFGLPDDNYNLKLDRSFANNDQRHRVSASVSWEISKGLRLSGSYLLNSPLPYTITTGTDDNNDTVFNDRPIGIKRNSERGRWQNQVDLTFSYMFSFFDKKGNNDGKSFAVVTTSSEAATGFDFTDSKKRFSLKFYATVNNIFNQNNFTNFVGVQTSPFFRQPISADNPRRIDLGLRFNF